MCPLLLVRMLRYGFLFILFLFFRLDSEASVFIAMLATPMTLSQTLFSVCAFRFLFADFHVKISIFFPSLFYGFCNFFICSFAAAIPIQSLFDLVGAQTRGNKITENNWRKQTMRVCVCLWCGLRAESCVCVCVFARENKKEWNAICWFSLRRTVCNGYY